MEDLVAVVAQVKKLLKLYFLRKYYSGLLKWRLKLQYTNISLNFLAEVFYFSKRSTRKKFSHCATEQISFPVFRNYMDTGDRTRKKTVETEKKDLKGMEGTLCDITLKNSLQETFSLPNFAHYFRILIISLLSFIYLTKKN